MANELTHSCHFPEYFADSLNRSAIDFGAKLDRIGSNNVDAGVPIAMEQGDVHVHIKHGYMGDEPIENNVIGPRSSSIIALKCSTAAAQVRAIADSARMPNGEAPGVYCVDGGNIDGRLYHDSSKIILVALDQNTRWQRFINDGYDSGSDNWVFTRSHDRKQLIFNRPTEPLSDSEEFMSSDDDSPQHFGVSFLDRKVLGTKRKASEAFGQAESCSRGTRSSKKLRLK